MNSLLPRSPKTVFVPPLRFGLYVHFHKTVWSKQEFLLFGVLKKMGMILCLQILCMEALMNFKFDQRNIVKYFGTFKLFHQQVMVFEWLDMNLDQYLVRASPLPLNEIRAIVQQVLPLPQRSRTLLVFGFHLYTFFFEGCQCTRCPGEYWTNPWGLAPKQHHGVKAPA